MSEKKSTVLTQEYVYVSEGSGEYCNASVSLDAIDTGQVVTIKPEQSMSFGEIEQVLYDFEADILKKMNMKLSGQYPARLDYNGEIFKIAFDDSHNVKGIVEL
ncbi:MAG: hypothetical protein FWG87_11150 [Defluviitaleaceae bacterium]|nr:hypothetical protein [Defluviitaleaceae bacterium]